MIFAGFTKREKKIFFIVAILILIALVYNFIAEPIVDKWRILNSHILISREKLIKNIRLLKEREKIVMQYGKYAEPSRAEGSDEEETARFLKEIETLATSSKVRITDIKPVPPKDLSYYKRFTVEVETQSAMVNIAKLLYALQRSKLILRVDRINIYSRGVEAKKVRAHMLITRVLVK